MTTLNVRVDENIKEKASKTLAALGLDMSSAVKMFLHQVIEEQGLPFTPTKNTIVLKRKLLKERWDAQIDWTIKHGKAYKSAKEALADWR